MTDESEQVINKPEVFCGFYGDLSFLNNIVGKDKLGILVDENDVSHSEANANDLERFINFHSDFDEILIATTEKKVCKSHQQHMSGKHCKTAVIKIFKTKV